MCEFTLKMYCGIKFCTMIKRFNIYIGSHLDYENLESVFSLKACLLKKNWSAFTRDQNLLEKCILSFEKPSVPMTDGFDYYQKVLLKRFTISP
jgi:hypothetical protein